MSAAKTFLQRYNERSTEEKKMIRIHIQLECGITERTFFNWLNGYIVPKEPHQKVIARILKRKTAFPKRESLQQVA
jgi:hypothetical protein